MVKLSEKYQRNELIIACGHVCGVAASYFLVSAGIISWPFGVVGVIILGVSYYACSERNFSSYEGDFSKIKEKINPLEKQLEKLYKENQYYVFNTEKKSQDSIIEGSITKSNIKKSLDKAQDQLSLLPKKIDIMTMVSQLSIDQTAKKHIIINLKDQVDLRNVCLKERILAAIIQDSNILTKNRLSSFVEQKIINVKVMKLCI